MGIQALYTAASGMAAMDTKLNVVANNLANIETVAFKRSRVNFEDIFYQTLEEPGKRTPLDAPKSTGRQVGLGVQMSGTQLNFQQGSFDTTNQELDVAIQGDGLFQVQTIVDGQQRTAYTRAGNFTRNALGELVLANSVGSRLEPAITVPQDTVEVIITPQGLVQARTQGSATFSDVGQIQLARFINPAGLKQLGRNLFLDTDASGPAIQGNPTQDGLGELQQGTLELSNVDPVRELVELIRTQRSFELNSQSLQSADQLLQTAANLRRL